MVPLSDQIVRSLDFISFLNDWNVLDLVKGILVFCVFNFIVDLSESAIWQKLLKHGITSTLDESSKVLFIAILDAC